MNRSLALAVLVIFGLIILLFSVRITPVVARDFGQWENSDLTIKQWYEGLMRPDVPNAPCCGEADAYWCDDYYARDGKAFCRITDDRPDGPRGRPHRDVGQEFEIPPRKLKWDRANPTGHGVIFLSYGGSVYCYVQPGGV